MLGANCEAPVLPRPYAARARSNPPSKTTRIGARGGIHADQDAQPEELGRSRDSSASCVGPAIYSGRERSPKVARKTCRLNEPIGGSWASARHITAPHA